MQRLGRSLFNAELDDQMQLKPLADVPDAGDGSLGANTTIGEQAARLAEITPDPAAPPAAPAQPVTTSPPAPAEPGAPSPPAPPAPPAPAMVVKKAASQELLEMQRKVQQRLDSIEETMRQPAAVTTSPTTPAPSTTPDPDAEFDRTLPEENRELLELLAWAEKNGHPELAGKAAEQRSYFRKLDEFAATGPDEEQLNEFRRNNKPVVADALVRKLNREKLLAQARAEAKAEILEETNKQLEPIRKKQYEMEVSPLLKRMHDGFMEKFTSPAVNGTNGHVEKRVDPVRAKTIMDMGLDKAATEFPTETPILRMHADLAREYLDLSYQLKPQDPNNRLHQELGNFLFHVEQQMLVAPESLRVRNGKTFLPSGQFAAAVKQDPDGARAKYWTTASDVDFVLERLEINANQLIAQKYAQLEREAEKMGYTRPAAAAAPAPGQPAVPAAAQPATPAPAVTPASSASPRGGGSISPGAASTAPVASPHADFLQHITPAASKLLGVA